MAGGGLALKLVQTILYGIEFCCAGIILGIYSYFLSVLADRDLAISAWKKAVEGLSGAACVYLIFAVLLTCFLGGKSFFAFLAIVFDLVFCAAMIAIAVMTRDGADNCQGYVNTPLGNGQSNTRGTFGRNGFGSGDGENVTYTVSLHTACRLNTAAFAVAIAGALLFFVSVLLQIAIARHHRREKRYGPSPTNNYTAGSGTNRNLRFWSRKPRTTGSADPEVAAVPASSGGLMADRADIRPSHETGYTGSTVAPETATYDSTGKPIVGGYHAAPTADGVNPYGYENRGTASNF